MKKVINNAFDMNLMSKSINEGFTRTLISSFAIQADPTVEALSELKTAVSEAVTNAIVHGYQNKPGMIHIKAKLYEDKSIKIIIKDKGVGIPDVKKAMEPLFTTGNEERAGMGFTIMETFSDKLKVVSKEGKGTSVIIEKNLAEK